MRFPFKVIAACAFAWVAMIGSACQTYDFEPVTPLAIAQKTDTKRVIATGLKPNLMLLVDRSGSMNLPVNPSSGTCTANCGVGTSFCPAGCATRWTELQNAMNTFLGNPAPVARMGLTIFPSNNQCGASNRTRINISASTNDAVTDLKNTADQINSVIQAIQGNSSAAEKPEGGTPIGLSLRWVGDNVTFPESDAREDFILLLTDGAPNCNPANAATDQASCRCTLASTAACFPPSQPMFKEGCLDDAGSTANVQALRQKNIKTIVVGFGADTATGDAFNALNDMASAGGFARACPSGNDSECGSNNTCLPTRECQKKYYAAANSTELSDALTLIAAGIDKAPCEYRLDTQPSDNEFVSVFINGQRIEGGPTTWEYDPSQGIINFIETGTVCPTLKAATPTQPADLEIRIVQAI
jgi:hypothetical protein